MSRALLVAHRHPSKTSVLESWVATLNRRLMPDNIVAHKPRVAREPGITTVVFSPNDSVHIRGTSVLLGIAIDGSDRWHIAGTESPDGSFAVLRNDERSVELIADATASRTIWYAESEDRFIASTSQRAIVALLGSFELNREVIPWMLSSGTLGPGAGWDARIKPVLPGEQVVLDRVRWRVRRHLEAAAFRGARHGDEAAHRKRLSETLERVAGKTSFDTQKWLLPLSGGVDSRGLLALLHNRAAVRTITWGLESAPQRAGNDAKIAARVARAFDVENRYFTTNVSAESRRRLMQRFFVAGEGRVANIPPFLDGFKVWRKLAEEGVEGIVRGDQAFGTAYSRDERAARVATKLETLEDHFAPEDVAAFEMPKQALPQRLARRSGESLQTWTDRLYQLHRLPRMLAGLTDLKSPYVDVVNPLLAREIVEAVRSMPDSARVDKRAWREYVTARSQGIPFARRPAVLPIRDFLNDTAMLELLLDRLQAERGGSILGPVFVDRVCRQLAAALSLGEEARVGTRTRGPLALVVPDSFRKLVRRRWPVKRVLAPTELAFRAFIVLGMAELLESDSKVLTPEMRRAASL